VKHLILPIRTFGYEIREKIFPLETTAMENCLKTVNNCLDIFTSCIPKDTNDSAAVNNPNNNSSYKLPKMSYYTLHLPTRPKVDDEIRIKAKLKARPKE
jgi:hypothetical protein